MNTMREAIQHKDRDSTIQQYLQELSITDELLRKEKQELTNNMNEERIAADTMKEKLQKDLKGKQDLLEMRNQETTNNEFPSINRKNNAKI